ncbi:MAG: DNA mismatch repair endonuclease MutL [Paludibacteraceae bacterium]|nr:DNA mismatch repair endonuclease MutL [Paludibacteraceae bacterium]
MMDIIHLLPDSVANQIAAGEVVQRPASCLKELVENSLDAGASRIQILVRDAGRTLLQIIDDGSGMSETDVRMAFERHATSKIREAADLFTLHTMGFRGEALASICAVAHVDVQTRRKEDEVGTRLEIAGSQVMRQEPCQCPVGTNIRVRNLFYNVPARRKFLKTDQTELRNLLTEFYHIALVYPKVQFTFVSNDEILMELPAGSEKQRIEQIFGKNSSKSFTGQLVDIKSDTEMVSIYGFVGKPEMAGKNAQQYFFVNGRFMRHPYFHKAVLTAYAGMLPNDYSPSYFIYFNINPSSIDVNIHPTKTEIKFADEQAIFQILMATIRESLGKFNVGPSIDFDRQGEIEMPIPSQNGTTTMPKVTCDPTYNPFRTSSKTYTPSGWDKLYGPLSSQDTHSASVVRSESPMDSKTDMEQEQMLFEGNVTDVSVWQYASRYLLLPVKGGILFVDQRRAHISVLYQQFLAQIAEHKGAMQQLLFPEELALSIDEMKLMQTMLNDLRAVGFDLEQISKQAFSISGVPALLGGENAVSVLKEILHNVLETGASVGQQWQKSIALALASSAAMPYGRALAEDAQRQLLSDWLALPACKLTPDGKKVAFVMTDDEIARKL